MDFLENVKDELMNLDNEKYGKELLAGIFLSMGSIFIEGGDSKISFTTSDNPLIRKIFNLLKQEFSFQPQIQILEREDSDKKNYQIILNSEESEIFLKELGYELGFFIKLEEIPKKLVDEDKKRRAFLRGVFLGSGYMSDPKKSYHLEISSENLGFLKALQEIIQEYQLDLNLSMRQKREILYLKNVEKIADFLSLMGAFQSVLKLHDIRAYKEINNQINRQMNSDFANMDKTAMASRKQREAIEKIIKNDRWNQLNDNLKSIALKRVEYPEESLQQLGELMDPPLSKSGVNYRLRQLIKIAEEIDEK